MSTIFRGLPSDVYLVWRETNMFREDQIQCTDESSSGWIGLACRFKSQHTTVKQDQITFEIDCTDNPSSEGKKFNPWKYKEIKQYTSGMTDTNLSRKDLILFLQFNHFLTKSSNWFWISRLRDLNSKLNQIKQYTENGRYTLRLFYFSVQPLFCNVLLSNRQC